MNKRFCIILAACILLVLQITAHADIIAPKRIVYPVHVRQDECVDVNRNFYANGENGYVSVKNAPSSKEEVTEIKNNSVLSISCEHNYEGEFWGFMEMGRITGWVPMKQLLLIYDLVSFTEEYRDKFYPYVGDYETLKMAEKIILWPWPGSGRVEAKMIIEAKRIENVRISHAYKDNDEREWGFINNIQYGNHNDVWVCISDPANGAIPAFNPPKPIIWKPAETGILNSEILVSSEILTIATDAGTDISKSKSYFLLFIFISVIVLASGTVVFIQVFWKPNKGKE
jgi:hypothetical protein